MPAAQSEMNWASTWLTWFGPSGVPAFGCHGCTAPWTASCCPAVVVAFSEVWYCW